MRSIRKKGFALVACLFFFLNSSVISLAITPNEARVIDIKVASSNRLRVLSRTMNGYKDTRSNISFLLSLTQVSMWYDFVTHYPGLGFTEEELEPYRNYLDVNIQKYNDSITNITNKNFIPDRIDINYTSQDRSVKAKQLADYMMNYSSKYGDKIYQGLLNDYNSKTDQKSKDEYLDSQSGIIKSLYLMSQRISDEYDQARGLCKVDDAQANGNYIYSISVQGIQGLSNKPNYKPIADKGRELAEKDIISNSGFTSMDGNTAYMKFTAEDTWDNKKSRYVNAEYLACISASSVYVPFISKVGEAQFIASLNSITSNNSEVVDTYSEINTLKKPLYIKDLPTDDKNYSENNSTATQVTVEEFINRVKEKKNGSLVTVKGGFAKSPDSDTSYAFSQGTGEKVDVSTGEKVDNNDTNSGLIPSSQVNTTNNNSTTSNSNNTGNNASNNSNSNQTANTNPTSPSNSTSSTTGKSTADKGKTKILTATETITDQSALTDPVFEFGERNANTETNLILMTNIILNKKIIEQVKNKDYRLLYINPFGDIVLDDDTVVVPASANATFYREDLGIVYNPNTAAFMDNYPTTSLTSNYFNASQGDEGKYVVAMLESTSRIGEDRVKKKQEADPVEHLGQSDTGPTEKLSFSFVQSISGSLGYYALPCVISEDKSNVSVDRTPYGAMPLELRMVIDGSDKITTMRAFNFSFEGSNIKKSIEAFFTSSKISQLGVNVATRTSETKVDFGETTTIFPVSGDLDEVSNEKYGFIGKRFYDSMTLNSDGERLLVNGRYNLRRITDTFIEGNQGLSDIAPFVKNIKETYSDGIALSNWQELIVDTAKTAESNFGSITGIIGLKSAYQDPIFSKLLYYSNKFILIIFTVVSLYFIQNYARKRINIIYTVTIVSLSLVITYLSLQVVPLYMSDVLNGGISLFSDDLGYKSLIMRQELYRDPYNVRVGYDEHGNFSLGTSSINLYRFSNDELKQLSGLEQIGEKSLLTGEPYVLDDLTGLYVQGDFLKINLDRLFAGISIKGSFSTTEIETPYRIDNYKVQSSVIDYYTPYFYVMDGFINNLNKSAELYNIPRRSLSYGNGLFKDSFMVSTYVKSDLFLNGDNLDKLSDQFSDEFVEKAKSQFGGDNIDFLGLHKKFVTDIQSEYNLVRDSLWFQTMCRLGYYDLQTGKVVDNTKMARMIEHVNDITKQYLIKNANTLAFESDENIVKVVSLFAVSELNSYISALDDNIYPQSLNYEEMKLGDILLPTLTKDYDRYIASDRNIIDYLYAEFKEPGLIIYTIIAVISFLIVKIMSYGVPILYLLLLACVVARLALNKVEKMQNIFKGYIKIFSVIYGCYCIFIITTATAHKFSTTVWTLILLLLIYLILFSIMTTVLYSLLRNISDFGNAAVNAKFSRFKPKGNVRGALQRYFGARQKYSNSGDDEEDIQRKNMLRGLTDKFSFDHSVDDAYDDYIQGSFMRGRSKTFKYDESDTKYRAKKRGKNKVSYDEEDIDYMDDKFDKYKM